MRLGAASAQGAPARTAAAGLPRSADAYLPLLATARATRTRRWRSCRAGRSANTITATSTCPTMSHPAPRGVPAARPVVDQPVLRIRVAAVASRAGRRPAPRPAQPEAARFPGRSFRSPGIREPIPGRVRPDRRLVVQRTEHARRRGEFLHARRRRYDVQRLRAGHARPLPRRLGRPRRK